MADQLYKGVYKMARQIQIRNDSASNWMLYNPILGAGEIGIQIDEVEGNLIKIGNGTSTWSALSFEIPSGGVPGIQGPVGPAGPAGADGDDGVDGAPGAAGAPGDPGLDGEDGSSWGSGVGAPPSEAGSIGDFYLDTSTLDVYSKTDETTWTIQANIKGAPGADGVDGNDGIDGATWLSGAVVPTTEGVDGDFYLDTETSNVYKKISGTWTLQVNIKGVTGEAGPKGDTGSIAVAAQDSTPPDTAVLGELFLDAAGSKLYICVTASVIDPASDAVWKYSTLI